MAMYRRMTYEDRISLNVLLKFGKTKSEIAEILNFHKSTISREIKRNFYFNSYSPFRAQDLSEDRYRRCRRRSKLTTEVCKLIQEKLQADWSPEQIAGRFKKEKTLSISHQAIYNLLRAQPELGADKLREARRRRGRGRYSQRKAAGKRLSIHKRPKIVARRERIGDWERDGMYGGNRQQLLVLCERKSRYTCLEQMGTASPIVVTEKTQNALQRVPIPTHTMTNDRGPEFRDHRSLKMPVYFCDVQKPQQKGTVENTIGLLRQYVSRKTDLKEITDEALRAIEDKINYRPRKILNYKTPYEVMHNTNVALATLI